VIRHAGLLALRLKGHWRGVLIEGPSGAGKSDLALRCLAAGFRLVADDRVLLWTSGGRLYGRAPDALAGLIEVRGLGVMAAPALNFSEIALVVACVEGPAAVERHPDPESAGLLGVSLPLRRLWPLEHAAPAKLRLALEYLGHGH
jgi:serine kinase of HPr protein (carbohydrate metabolism regulator)